jgi:hypothetical protein
MALPMKSFYKFIKVLFREIFKKIIG